MYLNIRKHRPELLIMLITVVKPQYGTFLNSQMPLNNYELRVEKCYANFYYLLLGTCSLFLSCRIPLVAKLSFTFYGSCRAQVYHHSAQPQSLLALLLAHFHAFHVFISDFLFLLFIRYGRLKSSST